METIKAQLKEAAQITINWKHRIEKAHGFQKQLTAVYIEGGKIREAITLRTYASSSFYTWSACVWLHCGTYDGASGKASGHHYCKESAAAAEALVNVGFAFNERIGGGIGMHAIQDALKAAAENLTGKPCQIITAHA